MKRLMRLLAVSQRISLVSPFTMVLNKSTEHAGKWQAVSQLPSLRSLRTCMRPPLMPLSLSSSLYAVANEAESCCALSRLRHQPYNSTRDIFSIALVIGCSPSSSVTSLLQFLYSSASPRMTTSFPLALVLTFCGSIAPIPSSEPSSTSEVS